MQSDRREKLADTEQSFRTFSWNCYRPLTRGHSLGKKFQTIAIFNIITRNYKSEESLLLITLRYGENSFVISYCQRWYTVKRFFFSIYRVSNTASRFTQAKYVYAVLSVSASINECVCVRLFYILIGWLDTASKVRVAKKIMRHVASMDAVGKIF